MNFRFRRGPGSKIGNYNLYRHGMEKSIVRVSQGIKSRRERRALQVLSRRRKKLEAFPELFCQVCGQVYSRDGAEGTWTLGGRCPSCVSIGANATTGKHCQNCGKFFLREEIISSGKTLAAWRACSPCLEKRRLKVKEIRVEVARNQGG
jgi:hypothetical protein